MMLIVSDIIVYIYFHNIDNCLLIVFILNNIIIIKNTYDAGQVWYKH
jgi:hypothetical protein